MIRNKVYPIGGFRTDDPSRYQDWRDFFIENLPNLKFDDPREHNQSAIAKLDTGDMNSAMNCPLSLVYLFGNKRAGTMSYCELGASRARGNCIIAVDHNDKKDSLIEQIASHYYTDKDRALEFLQKGEFNFNKHRPIKIENKTKTREPCKSILFSGSLEDAGMIELIKETSKFKEVYTRVPVSDLYDFSDKFDLVVVNFPQGEQHSKYGLYHMGLAYATEVPIIELEGNSKFPYPPLPGLARRVFMGKERFHVAKEYLERLQSQHISDEALICYELMAKYNK
jgi:hypothetical protein